MTDLHAYRARWQDFLTDCAILDSARRGLRNGYANASLDWDEACGRAARFEAGIAHLPIYQRAVAIESEALRYRDI